MARNGVAWSGRPGPSDPGSTINSSRGGPSPLPRRAGRSAGPAELRFDRPAVAGLLVHVLAVVPRLGRGQQRHQGVGFEEDRLDLRLGRVPPGRRRPPSRPGAARCRAGPSSAPASPPGSASGSLSSHEWLARWTTTRSPSPRRDAALAVAIGTARSQSPWITKSGTRAAPSWSSMSAVPPERRIDTAGCDQPPGTPDVPGDRRGDEPPELDGLTWVAEHGHGGQRVDGEQPPDPGEQRRREAEQVDHAVPGVARRWRRAGSPRSPARARPPPAR